MAQETAARGRVRIEQGHKRVRAYLNGALVADTVRPFLVWEVPYYPAYYIPVEDVRAQLLPTGKSEHSPRRRGRRGRGGRSRSTSTRATPTRGSTSWPARGTSGSRSTGSPSRTAAS